MARRANTAQGPAAVGRQESGELLRAVKTTQRQIKKRSIQKMPQHNGLHDSSEEISLSGQLGGNNKDRLTLCGSWILFVSLFGGELAQW